MIRVQTATPPGFALCRRFCRSLFQPDVRPTQGLGDEIHGLFKAFETLEHYTERHDQHRRPCWQAPGKEPTNG